MARKFGDRKQQVVPQKLKATIPAKDIGHEAAIAPDITLAVPERERLLLLDMTEVAIADLVAMVAQQLIIDQRKKWYEAYSHSSNTNIEFYSSEGRQTAYFEILQDKTLKLFGNVIYHELNDAGEPIVPLPDIPVYQITIGEANDSNFPVPDPYPVGVNDNSPYLVIHILKPLRGEKGEKGDKGIDGVDGVDGVNGVNGVNGTNGTNGADGECDCPVPPLTDPDGNPIPEPPGGGGGGGGYGSGPGGTPNPDQLDQSIAFTCISLGLTHGPHGTGVEYANLDITSLITDAATASGHYNSSTEDLLSVKLHQEAVCYTGALGSITLPFFNIPLTQGARKATINQATSNARLFLGSSDTVATGTITVEPPSGYNIGDVGAQVTAGGRVYNNDLILNMQGSNPIIYDGQFPALPGWLDWLFSAVLKTGPKTAAYHYMELCGLTKRRKPRGACAKDIGTGGYFWYWEVEQTADCWTNDGFDPLGLIQELHHATRQELFLVGDSSGVKITWSGRSDNNYMGITVSDPTTDPWTNLGEVHDTSGSNSHQREEKTLMFGSTQPAGKELAFELTGGTLTQTNIWQWILIQEIPA